MFTSPTAIFFFPAISGGAFGSSTLSLPLLSSLSLLEKFNVEAMTATNGVERSVDSLTVV